MKCQRCGGIMVPEKFHDGGGAFPGWRCIFCGEIIDPVIFRNRRTQTEVDRIARRRHFNMIGADLGRASVS